MSEFNWDAQEEAPAFDWDAQESSGPAEDKYSAADAGVMHGLNSASGNFLDELSGVGEAAGRAIGVKGMGGKFSDLELQSPSFDFKENYLEGRDNKRALLAEQKAEHPGAALGGTIVGSVVSPINKLTKATSLAKAGMAIGGVNALGASEADNAFDMATDTATGAGLGLMAGKGAEYAKGLVPAIQGTVDDIATAPLGKEGARGVVAGALDKTHRLGAAGNKLVDNLVEKITPSTGNAQSDQVLGGIAKGLSKVGRYGIVGKGQAALDGMEQLPKAAQWAAGKASPLIKSASEKALPHVRGLAAPVGNVSQNVTDFLMQRPQFKQLAEKNPKAFEALAGSMSSKFDPTKEIPEGQAQQDFLDGN